MCVFLGVWLPRQAKKEWHISKAITRQFAWQKETARWTTFFSTGSSGKQHSIEMHMVTTLYNGQAEAESHMKESQSFWADLYTYINLPRRKQ